MSTERLDDSSTQRLDDGSTQRLDDSSTQRMDDSSTQRMSSDIGAAQLSPQINAPKMALHNAGDSGSNLGEVFTAGQVVELNGRRYFIEDKISDTSGEAVVYKVSQEGNNYVLKYYKPGLPLPYTVISKIRDNPKSKIVRVYDFGKHQEQHFEVMEYAQGGTLEDYLKTNGAINDISKLKDIVGQIAEGLSQLHNELRIIYQDLKPDNIYFKDAAGTSIILGDFGISNVMLEGKNEAEVFASVTKEYAAPELARMVDNKLVIVDPSIDYFALGITMLHMWMGTKPFQGLNEAQRARQILNKDVTFPPNIQEDYKILIQGLINPLANDRWGSAHVKKWLSGESLVSDYQFTQLKYGTVNFTESESFSTPKELADLLEKYPDRGIRFLYSNNKEKSAIIEWLENAKDVYNLEIIKDLLKIADEDHEKIGGVYAVAYALNPDKPFVSHGKKKCFNYSEIASALMDEAEHYMKVLTNKEDFFYLYLLATEGANGPIIADKFHKYFVQYSPRRALNLLYLKLQDDDGKGITIGSKKYYDMDEIAGEQDRGQIDLIKQALMEKESIFNVWLADNSGGFLESADGFYEVQTKDRFYLLGKFPFLSYKELVPNWMTSAIIDLQIMVQQCPGRFDLFETYAKQGLPFNGQSENLDWKPTVLSFLATFYYDIAADDITKLELVKYLIGQGAEVNAYSGDGSLPLTTAVFKRNVPLVEILLDHGADPNKEENYAPIMWALCQNAEGEDEDVRFNIANLLLDKNANVNVARGDLTLLTLAIILDSPKKVLFIKRILDAGANPNKACDEGITPLMNSVVKYAKYTDDNSKKNELEVIEKLLSKRAKTEVLNKKGYWSPLMRAADFDAFDVAKLLIKYGAKKGFADADGDIAYVYAAKKNNKSIKQILDPGIEFSGMAALFTIAKVCISAIAILWVFLTMDVLARVISSASFSNKVLIGVSILSSHLLTFYLMSVIHGFRNNLIELKYLFDVDELHKPFLYIVGIPVVFPVSIGIMQFLTKFLPVNINELLLKPMEFFNVSSSGFVTFIMYLISLAAVFALQIVYEKFTFKFNRKVYIYNRHK